MRQSGGSQANPVEFLFLNKVYREECGEISNSPEGALLRNKKRADYVAQCTVNALQVYYQDFPTLDIDDPCHNMPTLPVTLRPTRPLYAFGSEGVKILSPSERSYESWWLGTLTIARTWRRESEPYIDNVRLNRQFQGGQYVDVNLYPGQSGIDPGLGYPANVEAMNLIGIAGNYLEALSSSRLTIVRQA